MKIDGPALCCKDIVDYSSTVTVFITCGPGDTIKGEFSQNGVINNLKHTPGVLSMARSMIADSGTRRCSLLYKVASTSRKITLLFSLILSFPI